ncbi:metallophosphoesterase family protein [Pontibacter pudoricolor]|uniref:metallophosphoesterase family protein n=1 Tax=Pontibacter pudoricolor TaxID=2694930 RepID=UPI001390ECBC|nr:metallophosphoesterase [Pontibacter pudoricolor]
MHFNNSLSAWLTKFLMVVLALPMLSCEKFEYSPYEVRLDKDELQINQRNIDKIQALNISPSEVLRFILIADTQGFYEENEILVSHINRNFPDADFLLLGGDITDFGLVKEFTMVNDEFKKLKMPYVAVVGNHDAINNGKEVFQAMYGKFDISFKVANKKFILLNTNYLEFDKKVPDLVWLENELKDAASYDHVFVMSHIAPISNEFGKEKAEIYERLLSQYNVSFSLHGHSHTYQFYTPENSTVPHLIAGSTEKLEYIVFTVAGDKVSFERVKI